MAASPTQMMADDITRIEMWECRTNNSSRRMEGIPLRIGEIYRHLGAKVVGTRTTRTRLAASAIDHDRAMAGQRQGS